MSTASTTATQLLTANEFWEYVQRPENESRNLDLIQGVVIEMSRPTRLHGIVTNSIGRILGNWAHGLGSGYVASNDAGVVLEEDPDSVLGPDVAYYTDVNKFEDVPPKWGDLAPVLAIEVLSPNDRYNKVLDKVGTYFRGGTRMVWVVDYEEHIVTIHRSLPDYTTLQGDTVIAVDDVLPGFRCKVSEFFQLPGDAKSTPPSS